MDENSTGSYKMGARWGGLGKIPSFQSLLWKEKAEMML